MDQSNNHSDVVNGWINDDWERFGSLVETVEKLNQLLPLDILSPPPPLISPEILQGLFSIMDTAEEKGVLNVLLAKTPLESILIIKETIDILVSVWNEVSTQAGMNEESQRYKAAAFSDPLFQTIYALSPEVETVVVVEVGGEVGVLGQKNLNKITVSSNLIRIHLMALGSIVCRILLEISK
ncbi:hypothetical protein PPACK8108_LOCUS4287 [Phakopsora pachyrhizi]|uniref:Uncharacterized protein n=1 Tax=Phakopsora pachyrhizi TaxID=170000 RepID=A0AAV0AN25_PHAPC|nr:hypothetical protein PPACK8108_LOCUS4287 [Phakopsora pachyrhizi]